MISMIFKYEKVCIFHIIISFSWISTFFHLSYFMVNPIYTFGIWDHHIMILFTSQEILLNSCNSMRLIFKRKSGEFPRAQFPTISKWCFYRNKNMPIFNFSSRVKIINSAGNFENTNKNFVFRLLEAYLIYANHDLLMNRFTLF